MKVLVVSDVHGQHEKLSLAFDKFEKEGYDKIILLGDLADSYDRSNEDILQCFKIALNKKRELGDNMELLMGNHELHYFYDGGYRCSGFRAELKAILNPYLTAHRDYFKVAYGIGTHLFTHAGVQREWYVKHFETLAKWADIAEIDYLEIKNLWKILNVVAQTSDVKALHEVGTIRGGDVYDKGGITWCDQEEMIWGGPLVGLHQVVGHTPQKFINRVEEFEGNTRYNNTSVTFCDVLGNSSNFLTLEINE